MKSEDEEDRRNKSLRTLRARGALPAIGSRQREMEEKLDLIKNQAPSRVDADSPVENSQQISEKQTPTETPHHNRPSSIRA